MAISDLVYIFHDGNFELNEYATLTMDIDLKPVENNDSDELCVLHYIDGCELEIIHTSYTKSTNGQFASVKVKSFTG